jgi:hypothetical protein
MILSLKTTSSSQPDWNRRGYKPRVPALRDLVFHQVHREKRDGRRTKTTGHPQADEEINAPDVDQVSDAGREEIGNSDGKAAIRFISWR